MTFGRSPSDRDNTSAFGPAPAALDAPYGQLADGFGGRGPAPDGFGGHGPVPAGFGGAPRAPVQLDAAADRAGDASRAHDIADAATAGAGHDLPHLDTIQRAFGPHDVSGVRAHTDDAAAHGSAQLGAQAFASGNDVAFASPNPDLHTAAHEAAHVVQQRGGVQLKDGLGETGDAYEQHADAVADAVVRGDSAAELLGPVASSPGAGVQRRAIQRDAAPRRGSEGPVSHADLEEATGRAAATGRYMNLLSLVFVAMRDAVETTCDLLEKRAPKRSNRLAPLLEAAATASIAGASGLVADIIARRVGGVLVKKFLNDAVKDQIKRSLLAGSQQARAEDDPEVHIAFKSAQLGKIRQAQAHFIRDFATGPGAILRDMSSADIESLIQSTDITDKDADVQAATARQVAVEWTNLVARLHHGAGGWDLWAGPNGSKDARRPRDAAAPPTGERDEVHPSDGNVDPNSSSVRASLNDEPNSANPELSGILEIDLWAIEEYSPFEGYAVPPKPDIIEFKFAIEPARHLGMRMRGMNGHVVDLLAGATQVKDLPVNKIVTLYSGFTIVGRFLITADGYVRRDSMRGGFRDEDSYVNAAADVAQALSPAMLR